MSNVIETFVTGAERHAEHPFGNAWIAIVMPLVMEMIQQCLNNRGQLQRFAEGQRSFSQLSALRVRCRQAARANNVGPLRSLAVGNNMADAILRELDSAARGGRMGDVSDPYQAAIDEVAAVLG